MTRTGDLLSGKFRSNLSSQVAQWRATFRLFGLRGWAVVALGAVAALLLIGIPNAIIDNALFTRTTLIRVQDYVFWIATALLIGLVAGSFTVPLAKRGGGKAASGGLLSFFAVGCPVCNKLVVSLLGVSGALTYFAPAQLYIGIASVALLLWSLHLRMMAISRSCCVIPPQGEALQADREEI